MSQPTPRKYPAEFKEHAVKLAVESEQSIAQTARELGVNENTLHTWIGKYHRTERQEKEVHDEYLYEELKRLRKFAYEYPCRGSPRAGRRSLAPLFCAGVFSETSGIFGVLSKEIPFFWSR